MSPIKYLPVAVAACLAAADAQPPGRRRPPYMQRLVEKFDANENGRVDGAERKAALDWIKAEREKSPPRHRSRTDPDRGIEPTKVAKDDIPAFPEKGLYDLDVIQTIALDFANPAWHTDMELYWRTGIEEPATLTMDGKDYRDVGVHFRGSSSFFTVIGRKKKSFAISMDWAHRKQRLKGYKSLNLLSAHADPSFMRTVLFAHIAGHYVKMPRACFVHLVVNGESWGLYINDQQINKDFIEEAFDTRKGSRWKIGPNFAGQAALAYLGPEKEKYAKQYQLKFADSKAEAWTALIALCKTLSESSPEELEAELPKMLDIENALWFLALDNVLMDGDGYHYRGSDYALYRHPDGRFYPLFRDNNEAFTYSGGPGGFGRPGQRRSRGPGSKLEPLALVDEERAALCKALFSVAKWRASYLAKCRTVRDEWLDWKVIGPIVAKWRARIEPMIERDDKSLYGHEAFVTALDEGSGRKPGLKSFVQARRAFLLASEHLRGPK